MKYFDEFTQIVASLKPGERIIADKLLLGEGWGGDFGVILSGGFTPPDRVLERVIGSAYTHRYYFHQYSGALIFERLHGELPEGVRSYVSPDRRGWFNLRDDRLFQHRAVSMSIDDEAKIKCALHGHKWIPAKVLPLPEPMPVVPTDFTEEVIYLVDGRICDTCRVQERT